MTKSRNPSDVVTLSVRQFGARGDGRTNDQRSLQEAIDRCAARGGGRLVVPAGRYRTGTLQLRSGVELHLEAGAVIAAIDDQRLFPVICPTPFGNLPGHIRALIWADGARDVGITGPGAVDGGGDSPLWGEEAARTLFRPALVFVRNCCRVRIADVQLRYSCFWTLHLLGCDDVAVRGISILTHEHRINADGIDPDGCRDVRISDCRIESCDDAICIKSTEGRACENLVVSNCVLSSRCAAIKVGTEAVGDVRNVTVSNCVVRDSRVGLALYMKDGSVYERLHFSNLVMECDGDFPILVDVSPRYHRRPRRGTIRDVRLEAITLAGRGRVLLEGLPDHPIENLRIRDLTCLVTGDCQPASCRKPAGARRQDPDPRAPNHAARPYHLVGVHLKDCDIRGLTLIERRPRSADRGVACLLHSRDVALDYRSGLTVPRRAKEVQTVACRRVRVLRSGQSRRSEGQ